MGFRLRNSIIAFAVFGSLSLAHAEEDFTFSCTADMGASFGCTNLPAACAEWYPKCAMVGALAGRTIPGFCKGANFKVVALPNSKAASTGDSSPSVAAGMISHPVGANAGASSGAVLPSSAPVQAPPPQPIPVAAPLATSPAPPPPSESAKPLPPGAKQNFDDPWYDYVSPSAFETLVQQLKADPELREKLRARLKSGLGPDGEATPQDKLDFFRRALAAADLRAGRNSLDALKPLDGVFTK